MQTQAPVSPPEPTATGATSRTRPRRPLRTVLWVLLALSAAGIAGYAVPPYLSGDPSNSTIPLNVAVDAHFLALLIHGVPGGTALLIGPIQFLPVVRRRWPRFHRITGRIYMIAVALSVVVSVYAALVAVTGLDTQAAFLILAVGWAFTLVMGYRTIRRGEVQLHQVWMIRNYALTFAAVTLRLYLVIGLTVQGSVPSITFDDIYGMAVWGSILGNVFVAEWLIVQRVISPRLRRRRTVKAAADGAATA